ncbi:MAG: hypothetical protein BroJett018_11900 [Chloroflexota bacterium]|nr:MAG: hypothetical protein BroJett018_11900 [Chloroflexota bacterium]
MTTNLSKFAYRSKLGEGPIHKFNARYILTFSRFLVISENGLMDGTGIDSQTDGHEWPG